MENKFPIMTVVKGALAAPLSHPKSLIKTIVILLLALALPAAYAIKNGITLEILKGFSDPNNADMIAEHALTVGMLYLLVVVIFAPVSAYLFNYWVRFGANGPDGAKFPTKGQAISSALVNMIKFFFIFLLLGIVVLVITWVLSIIGLAPDTAEQVEMMASEDFRGLTMATFFSSVIVLIIVSIIYSQVSANLTQTALKSEVEGLEHPHKIDFAIVLFLVYLVSFLPGVLAGLLNSMTLSMILSATLGVYVTLCIAVAHGIRYSLCIQDSSSEEQEGSE